MTTAIERILTIRAFPFVLSAVFVAFISPIQTLAADAPPCPTTPKASIAAAREALRSKDASADRNALLCLIEAVAQLDERLSDTLAGRIEFEKITSKAYYPSANSATAGAK